MDITQDRIDAIVRERRTRRIPGMTSDIDDTYVRPGQGVALAVANVVHHFDPSLPADIIGEGIRRNDWSHPVFENDAFQTLLKRALVQPEIYRDCEVIKEARSARRRLHNILPFVAFISSRRENLREVTSENLAEDPPHIPIFLCPDAIPNGGGPKWKARTIIGFRRHGGSKWVRAHLDDDPLLVQYWKEVWLQTGITLLLVGNHTIAQNGVIVCRNYDQVVHEAAGLTGLK